MVEQSAQLDRIFSSLSHPIRRDILRRGAKKEMSIGELAEPYKLTFAAISKHVQVLEKAELITKHRRGKQYFVSLSPAAFDDAAAYLRHYEKFWNDRFDRLERHLTSFPEMPKKS